MEKRNNSEDVTTSQEGSSSKRQKKKSSPLNTGDMMFQQAVRKGELSFIQSRVQNGEIDGESLSLAFITAAKHGHVHILQYLWENNGISSIDLVEPILNRGALSIACNHGHLECVTFLLSTGANVNHQDCHGMTPLMICCGSGRRALVQLLLNAGADRDIITHNINPKKAIDFCTSQTLRDMLLTDTTLPQYTITKSYPIHLCFHNHNEMDKGEDYGDTGALHTLHISFLQFPLTKTRCIRYGKAVHTSVNHAVDTATIMVDVTIVLKCNTDRCALDRELKMLQELQKQWQQQQQGDGLREDSPFIRPLCEEIVVFREVHHHTSSSSSSSSYISSYISTSGNTNTSSHLNTSNMDEHKSVERNYNEWFGMILEKGVCDLHGLGSALAQSMSKTSSLSSSCAGGATAAAAGRGGGVTSSTLPPPLHTAVPPSRPSSSLHGHPLLYLAEQCCRIVHSIHQIGMVWCDCKPANLVVFLRPLSSPSHPSSPSAPTDADAATSTSTNRVQNAWKPQQPHQSYTPTHLAHHLLNHDLSSLQHLPQPITLQAIDLGGCQRINTIISVTNITCTVKFLAPEIARVLVSAHTNSDGDGDVLGVTMDPKLDSWSLGVTLFQLFHPTFQTLSLSSVEQTEVDAVRLDNGHNYNNHKLSDWTLTQLASPDLHALQVAVDSSIDIVVTHIETVMNTSLLPPPPSPSIAETIPRTMSKNSQHNEEISMKTLEMMSVATNMIDLVNIIRSLLRVHPEERATVSQAMESFERIKNRWKDKEKEITSKYY